MITLSVIGIFLCILCIWILKNSRKNHEPVLKMWWVLGIGISALIPVWNLILGLSILPTIGIAYLAEELRWKTNKGVPNKFRVFLNRTIS